MSTLSPVHHFRGDVVWRAAHGLPSLLIFFGNKHGSQAKIAQFDIHVAVEKDVAHFQVSMRDISLVEVFDCAAELNHEPAYLGQAQAFPLMDHLHY